MGQLVSSRPAIQRTSVLGITSVVALGAGLALAVVKGPVYLLIPLSPILILLILLSPASRLAFVAFGGLLTLQSSQELGPPKLAYLLGMSIAFGAASLNVRRHPGGSNRFLIACSALLFGLVAISFPVALLNGTDPIAWLRDAASYLLIGAVPVLIADASSSVSRRTVIIVFVTAGLLSTISFGLLWVGPTHRHLVDLPLDRLVYPSFLFASALLALSLFKTLSGGRGSAPWFVLAALICVVLLVTGTRTTLLLLVIPVAFLMSKQFRTGRPKRFLILAGAGAVVLVTGWYFLQFSSANTAALLGRFVSFDQLVNDPTSDLSLVDRLGQTGAAWSAFLSSPVFGVGLGHDFTWISYLGRPVTRFTIDTGLSFLAKLGLVGAAALVIAFRLIWRATAWGRANYPQMALVLTSYFVLLLCYLAFGNPFEEKGFGLALLFLGALLGDSAHGSRAGYGVRRGTRVKPGPSTNPSLSTVGPAELRS